MQAAGRAAALLAVVTAACSGSVRFKDATLDDVIDATEADEGVDVLVEELDPLDADDMEEATDLVVDPVADVPCTTDDECDNGLYCDGQEYCHTTSGVCRSTPDVDCDDGLDCTVDECIEETDSCDHVVDETSWTHGECDCPIDVAVPGSYTGSTSGMGSIYEGSCATDSGLPEAVHRLLISGTVDVHVDLGGSAIMSIVYMRNGACDGTELDCALSTLSGIDMTLAPGTYFLIVDGRFDGAVGDYTLYLRESFTPVSVSGNDDCSGAHAISADGSVSGSTAAMTDTATSAGCTTCEAGGFDAWFTFTLSAPSHVDIDTAGSSFDTILHVREGTCTGTEVACDDSSGPGNASRLGLSLSAGTYYVIVDGCRPTARGSYELTLTGL
jgi:hypothetical protein